MSGDSSRGSDGNHIYGFPVNLLVLKGWSGGQEGPETLSGASNAIHNNAKSWFTFFAPVLECTVEFPRGYMTCVTTDLMLKTHGNPAVSG